MSNHLNHVWSPPYWRLIRHAWVNKHHAPSSLKGLPVPRFVKENHDWALNMCRAIADRRVTLRHPLNIHKEWSHRLLWRISVQEFSRRCKKLRPLAGGTDRPWPDMTWSLLRLRLRECWLLRWSRFFYLNSNRSWLNFIHWTITCRDRTKTT